MTGRKCNIKVESVQFIGHEKDSYCEDYEGIYFDRDEKKYLQYKRLSEDGESSALISFNEKEMTLTQQGDLKSKLSFRAGKKTYNEYLTPAGAITLCIYTDSYETLETDSSIDIHLRYRIVTGADSVVTEMRITADLKK